MDRLGAVAGHLLAGAQASGAAAAAAGVTNRRVTLQHNPSGAPEHADFQIATETLAGPAAGEMLLKTKWLTLDPYMRGLDNTGTMNREDALGQTIIGGTVSEVVESHCEGYAAGDIVVGYFGWQEYAIATPDDVQWGHPRYPIEKWDPARGEPSTAVGILGMTGYTAFHGLLNVADAQPGETICVSAASGAVGQVVGQLAKIMGCRAVGIAGGPVKCGFCVSELGFDACIDYKAGGLAEQLAAACPDGIDVGPTSCVAATHCSCCAVSLPAARAADYMYWLLPAGCWLQVYFENVGGDVLEAVLPLLNTGCRVPVCGWVSQYNTAENNKARTEQTGTPLVRLAEHGLTESGRPSLGPEGKIEPGGFRFFSFIELAPRQPEAMAALRAMSGWIAAGQLQYKESITEGIESAPGAFIGMLEGKNFGKTMVQMAP